MTKSSKLILDDILMDIFFVKLCSCSVAILETHSKLFTKLLLKTFYLALLLLKISHEDIEIVPQKHVSFIWELVSVFIDNLSSFIVLYQNSPNNIYFSVIFDYSNVTDYSRSIFF